MKSDITSIDRLEATRNDLDDGIIEMLFLRKYSEDDSPTVGDGIRSGWWFEESTYNTPFRGAALDILSTDIADGAQDIDWKFNTMIAGTLTEFLHVDADGGFIIKLSPLVLSTDDAITEFRVHNWATDGDPIITWALGTEAVADIKFAMGVDDGDSDLLKLYSEDWQGTGVEILNVSAAATGLWKHLQGVEIEPTNAAGRTALLIDNNDTDQIALEIEAANIDADVFQITANALTSSGVLDATLDALTTGFGIRLASTSNVLAAGEMLTIEHIPTAVTVAKTGDGIDVDFDRTLAAGAVTDNYNAMSLTRTSQTSAAVTITAQGSVLRVENADTAGGGGTITDSVDVLQLVQDAVSTGNSLDIDHNAESVAISLIGSQTTADVIDISVAGLTEGTVIDISDLDAITIGKALHIDATGVTQTTGILAHLDSGSTALTGVGRLLFVDHTAAATVSGTISEFQTIANDETILTQFTADSLTSGQVISLTADALTSGIGVNLTSTSTALTTSGRLLRVIHSADFNDAGGYIAEISGAFTTGRGLNIVNNAITDGFLTHINSSSVVLDATGRMLMVDHTGAATVSGVLAEFKTLAADETVLAQFTADALVSGVALKVSTDALVSGTAVDINGDSSVLEGGRLLVVSHIGSASGISNKSVSLASVTSARTETGANTPSDDYDVFSVTRSTISTNAGATFTAAGSVIRIQNVATATLGIVTDSVDVLELVQDADSTGNSINIDHNAESVALSLVGSQTTADVLDISVAGLLSGTVIDISNLDAITTGKGIHIDATGVTQTDGILIHVDSGSTALTATGRLLLVDHTGATTTAQGAIAEIASAATDDTTIFKVTASAALAAGIAQDISVALLTTGTALDIGDLDAIISGKGINVASANNTLTSGILVDIAAASTALTTNGRLLKVAHSADFNDVGGYIAEFSGAFTTGRLVNITNDVVTDGFLAHINSSSAVLDATGRMLLVDHTGTATISSILAEIASNATDETVIFRVSASSTLIGGVAVDISVASMTTGMALDISDADALTTGGIGDFSSNSVDVSARQLIHIHNENVLAVGTVPLNIANAAAGNDVEVVNLDPGTTGVILDLHHDSANPAVDDVVASLRFAGEDSGGVKTIFGQIDYIIADETSGSEEGRAIHYTPTLDGNLVEIFREEVGDLKPTRLNSQSYEWIEDFDDEASGVQFEAGLVADWWTTAGTNYNANNVTYTAGPGGTVQAVTAGSNDDSVTSIGTSVFRVNADPVLEARFKVADITNVWICVGFVEGAFADKGTLDDDIIVVGIDSDNGHGFGAAQIVAVTNDNNAGGVYSDCGVTITLDTYITIRIDCTDTEQPRIWVNNTGGQITAANEVDPASITGTIQAGISIAPYFMVQSLSGAADTFTIDYIKTWQTRA